VIFIIVGENIIMENHSSGSLDILSEDIDYEEDEIDVDLEMLMQSRQFEEDLINSFTFNMYSVKSSAPSPLWVYCSITHNIIRIWPKTALVVIDENKFKLARLDESIECLIGQNLIQIPKKLIDMGDWH
jgi:hypothetical protein